MILAKEGRWMPLIFPPTTPWSALVVSVLSMGLVISVLGAVAAPNFGDPLPG
jgi:VIT1/CCC1 family predicted Fe2+/Mn2+ transporter